MHARRQMRRERGDDRAFDRADVGDDRARLQRRRDLARRLRVGADRRAEDDEIGVRRRLARRRRRRRRRASAPRRARAPAATRRAIDDRRRAALRAARRARDRGADQADADDREALERPARRAAARAYRSRVAVRHEVRQRRDDAAVGLFVADRQAQAIGQAIGGDRAQHEAARAQECVGVRGRAPGGSRETAAAGNCRRSASPRRPSAANLLARASGSQRVVMRDRRVDMRGIRDRRDARRDRRAVDVERRRARG